MSHELCTRSHWEMYVYDISLCQTSTPRDRGARTSILQRDSSHHHGCQVHVMLTDSMSFHVICTSNHCVMLLYDMRVFRKWIPCARGTRTSILQHGSSHHRICIHHMSGLCPVCASSRCELYVYNI